MNDVWSNPTTPSAHDDAPVPEAGATPSPAATPRKRPKLTVDQVLGWADEFHRLHGRWPAKDDGRVPAANATWATLNLLLFKGGRGLPPSGGLNLLLVQRRQADLIVRRRPDLTEVQILAWARAHRERTGKIPWKMAGDIPEAPGDDWRSIDNALAKGLRGIPGGTNLAKFLAGHGMAGPRYQPRLSAERILQWADAHHARIGEWPTREAGPVTEAPDENWRAIDGALRAGTRGLPGGSGLHQLLVLTSRLEGMRPLTIDEIRRWAEAHRLRTGRWPTKETGAVAEAPGETWANLQDVLRTGRRGLPGGQTLAGILRDPIAAEAPAIPEYELLPSGRRKPRLYQHRLDDRQILDWADAYYRKHHRWPGVDDGLVQPGGPDWGMINRTLLRGGKGLRRTRGGLAWFLAEHRGATMRGASKPPLQLEQVRAWAKAHHDRTGKWPTRKTGPVPEAPGNTWSQITDSMLAGTRGLPGGISLSDWLEKEFGAVKWERRDLAPLPADRTIFHWAKLYRARTGRWPTVTADMTDLPEAREWSWSRIDRRLRRRQPASSLPRLLARQQGFLPVRERPPLTEAQIVSWAKCYRDAHGKLPTLKSGMVLDERSLNTGNTWRAIQSALEWGVRGLPGGDTLSRLLKRNFGQAIHRGP